MVAFFAVNITILKKYYYFYFLDSKLKKIVVMKYAKIKTVFYLFFMSVLLTMVSSCRQDLNDSSLAETVWIHQLDGIDPIQEDARSKALVFGKNTIECYFLNVEGKVIRLYQTYKYTKEDYTILIDNETYEIIGEHYFIFQEQVYYISARKVTDLFE